MKVVSIKKVGARTVRNLSVSKNHTFITANGIVTHNCDQLGSSCMALQSVLQNKPYYVKKTNEMVYPKEGFTIIATANTKGDGNAGDRFVGANVLNEAFLERFNCVFEQDYPPAKVEMKILSKMCDNNVFLVNIVRWASSIRENYKIGTISRCITTRRLVQIVKNFQVFGSQKTAIQYGINRFDSDTRDAMMDYYENLNSITYNDGLDEYLPQKTMEDISPKYKYPEKDDSLQSIPIGNYIAEFMTRPKGSSNATNLTINPTLQSAFETAFPNKTDYGMVSKNRSPIETNADRIEKLKQLYNYKTVTDIHLIDYISRLNDTDEYL